MFLGAKVVSLSDSAGTVHVKDGFTEELLAEVMELKTLNVAVSLNLHLNTVLNTLKVNVLGVSNVISRFHVRLKTNLMRMMQQRFLQTA